MFANQFDIKGDLGNLDDIRCTRYTAVQRNPPRIPSHRFDHHNPFMGFCHRVEAVCCLGGDAYCRVKIEGDYCAAEIVVNCIIIQVYAKGLPEERYPRF
jgi:hypothetical protein